MNGACFKLCSVFYQSIGPCIICLFLTDYLYSVAANPKPSGSRGAENDSVPHSTDFLENMPLDNKAINHCILCVYQK